MNSGIFSSKLCNLVFFENESFLMHHLPSWKGGEEQLFLVDTKMESSEAVWQGGGRRLIRLVPSTFSSSLIFPSYCDIFQEKLCRWKQESGSLKHPLDKKGQESAWTLNSSRDYRGFASALPMSRRIFFSNVTVPQALRATAGFPTEELFM